MFVDKERHNRVMVLVSDGEDLEGEVDEAVRKAKEAGVVVHTVGVGTEAGQPVPDFDREGKSIGFKKDEQGGAVVSRLNAATLEAIARGTGGRFFRITARGHEPFGPGRGHRGHGAEDPGPRVLLPAQGALPGAAGRGPRRHRRGPPPAPAAPSLRQAPRPGAPGRRPRRRPPGTAPTFAETPPPSAASPAASPAPAAAAPARKPGVLDEVLLRPRRLAAEGRSEYERGNHPAALQSFERAATLRPADPAARYNLADGLYKNGKFPEAATLYRSLGEDARSPLAAPARYNLGNTLFQQQDYKGAIQAYRDALRVAPDDGDTLRNLETALRALQRSRKSSRRRSSRTRPSQDQDKNKTRSRAEAGPEGRAEAGGRQEAAGLEGPEARDPRGEGAEALPAGGRHAEGAGHAAPGRAPAEREERAEEAPGREAGRAQEGQGLVSGRRPRPRPPGGPAARGRRGHGPGRGGRQEDRGRRPGPAHDQRRRLRVPPRWRRWRAAGFRTSGSWPGLRSRPRCRS